MLIIMTKLAILKLNYVVMWHNIAVFQTTACFHFHFSERKSISAAQVCITMQINNTVNCTIIANYYN